MKKSFKGFINYGVLAAEKKQVWTEAAPHAYAVVSEKVEIIVPDGWELGENEYGCLLVTAPWDETYRLGDLLKGNENPYLTGINKNGSGFRIKLNWRKTEE